MRFRLVFVAFVISVSVTAAAQILTTGVPWWFAPPTIFPIETGANPCGTADGIKAVSLAADDRNVMMYYLCNDGRQFLKHWPQGDVLPPGTVKKEAEQATVKPLCIAGMVPSTHMGLCVPKNHPWADR